MKLRTLFPALLVSFLIYGSCKKGSNNAQPETNLNLITGRWHYLGDTVKGYLRNKFVGSSYYTAGDNAYVVFNANGKGYHDGGNDNATFDYRIKGKILYMDYPESYHRSSDHDTIAILSLTTNRMVIDYGPYLNFNKDTKVYTTIGVLSR